MELENIMLSEIRQARNANSHILSLLQITAFNFCVGVCMHVSVNVGRR